MNRYEAYLVERPIVMLDTFTGYWVYLEEIVNGLALPRGTQRMDWAMSEIVRTRVDWARANLLFDNTYAIINAHGMTAQSYPPNQSSKHISKHPLWGKCRYE